MQSCLQRLHVHEEGAHDEPPVVQQVEAGQLALLGVADGDLHHLAVYEALHAGGCWKSILREPQWVRAWMMKMSTTIPSCFNVYLQQPGFA